VSVLPASGCTAGLTASEFFRYRCLSGADLVAGVALTTTSAAEAEALLDFCSLNPEMGRGKFLGRMLTCGSRTVQDPSMEHTGAQWGNGDPCANGWYGVTCDAAGAHVTAM